MADMDWGWKRKKKSGDDLLGDPEEPLDKETLTDQEVNDLMELLYEENANNGDNFDVSKRNIGSFLRQNNDKRTLASIAKDDDSVEEEKVSFTLIYIKNCKQLMVNIARTIFHSKIANSKFMYILFRKIGFLRQQENEVQWTIPKVRFLCNYLVVACLF